MDSIEYYDRNAEQFIRSTFEADMSKLLEKFISYLPEKARILDVGCGSGRDSLWLMDRGYEVYAHDGSGAMVEHCKTFMGERVSLSSFEEFQTDKTFHGIWACASLLHVERSLLPMVLKKYVRLLKKNGVLFASFKKKETDHEKEGRRFTNMTEESLRALIRECSQLEILEILLTQDVREGRKDEAWISILSRKSE